MQKNNFFTRKEKPCIVTIENGCAEKDRRGKNERQPYGQYEQKGSYPGIDYCHTPFAGLLLYFVYESVKNRGRRTG